MATIQPLFGEQIILQVGDGASPETFSAASVVNTTRSFSISTSVESDELIDLANQSAPAQTVRRVKSTDIKFDGAGMLHKPDLKTYVDWANGGVVKNCKIVSGTVTITGPFVLTSFQLTGERAKSVEASLTLEQAGALTVTTTV